MGKRKEFTAVVISDKMQKTVIVRIMHLARHHKYSKTVRLHNKFKAHDEKGIAHIGDIVSIMETRPLSKDKRFIIKAVLKKSQKTNVALPEEII
jgi:small subunit ribosomal protein S17